MTVGPVHWGSYPGELIEDVMAVLLLQERPTAQHRRPSQGDGGVDVYEPVAGDYHVFQIKRFTESLSANDKAKIAESLERVKINPRLDGPVVQWSLVIPLNPTSGDDEWFNELTADAGFACDWRGLTFWHSEASKYWFVISYFLENGKAELEAKVRTLAQLLGRPTDPVRPVDVVTSLGDLHQELNRTDPYYRYDLRVTSARPSVDPQAVMTTTMPVENGSFVTVDVYARFPQAVLDRPIGGNFTFAVLDQEAGVDLRDAFQAHQDYGTAFEIPPEAVHAVAFNVPGGLGSTSERSAWQIQVHAPATQPDIPLWADIEVIAEDGTAIGSALLPIATLSKGQKGLELRASESTGHLHLELRLEFPVHGRLRLEYSLQLERVPGAPVATVGPGYRLVANIRRPHLLRFRLRSTFNVMTQAELPLGEPPLSNWESGLWHLDLLEQLQKFTTTPLVFPESDEERQSVRRAIALLRGETYEFEEHWTGASEGSEEELPALRECIEGDGGFQRTEPLTVSNGGNEVLVGSCLLRCADARILGVEQLSGGRVRVSFEGNKVVESGGPLPESQPPETESESTQSGGAEGGDS
ncbi:MAG: hypothetical protein JWM85_3217 [Acidimicrobiaceae bacterium]|nr:hypothetical protein [Acidimicrobiaceae bacterium]